MGWERKRGKLEEFNRLLRGARDTSFIVRTADDALLQVDPLRDHARLRHATAARCRAQTRRRRNSSAQSAAHRSSDQPRRLRLRHPATARQHLARQCIAFEVCANLFRQHRNRSLHDRSVRRLSGSSSAKVTSPAKDSTTLMHFKRTLEQSRAGEFAAQSRSL